MPSLRNQVDLMRYNPYGWTEAEIAMGATSERQLECKRVYRELQAMKVEDELSKNAEAHRMRQKAAVAAARKSKAEKESSAMALEDACASRWRRENYQTPEQNLDDWLDRALAMSKEITAAAFSPRTSSTAVAVKQLEPQTNPEVEPQELAAGWVEWI